ncbi:MAG: YegP family protein [Phycisphaerales bacterium]
MQLQFVMFFADGAWRWRLVKAEGGVIATSAEGYESQDACREAIELVKSSWRASVQITCQT